MRVMHVINGSGWGGSYQIAAQICAWQCGKGIDAVVCLLGGGASKERVLRLGAPLLSHDLDNGHASKRERWSDLQRGFEQIAKEWRPDVISTHMPLSHLLTQRMLSRRSGPKWVAVVHQSWRMFGHSRVHGGSPFRKWYMMLRHGLGDAFITSRAHRIVAVSEAIRRDCLRVGMAKHRVTRIYNGIVPVESRLVPKLRLQLRIPDDHRVIGGLGQLNPNKGFDQVIKAFLSLADRFPDVHVLIAGGTSGTNHFRDVLVRLRDESAHGSRIHILGEQKSGPEFMANVDICAIPSLEEAFSLTLAEAMQLGKPSVVTSAGGCQEVARDGLESLVFKSRNVADLAAKLERLLTDRELAARLGKAAEARARTALTLDRCANEHIGLYHELLGAAPAKLPRAAEQPE
ncbi:MAG TPA: glycosyltransferase family 4 protein [Planctomycetota bacterium]